jgi:hypothetical protein
MTNASNIRESGKIHKLIRTGNKKEDLVNVVRILYYLVIQ